MKFWETPETLKITLYVSSRMMCFSLCSDQSAFCANGTEDCGLVEGEEFAVVYIVNHV